MSVAIAVTFVWIGVVVGISFIEAPLKFRAPGVTLAIGLGIGRLVFRVINLLETAMAAVVVLAVVLSGPPPIVVVPLMVAVAALAVQLAAVRPRLTRRSNLVLAGGDAPRSQAHLAYVALEVVKLLALIVGGVAALAAM